MTGKTVQDSREESQEVQNLKIKMQVSKRQRGQKTAGIEAWTSREIDGTSSKFEHIESHLREGCLL